VFSEEAEQDEYYLVRDLDMDVVFGYYASRVMDQATGRYLYH
jgi:hypothetical protein